MTQTTESLPAIVARGALAREFQLRTEQSTALVGACRAVLDASGNAGEKSAALLQTVAHALAVDVHTPAVSPAELAAAFPTQAARRAVADALVIPACIECEVTAAGEACVQSFASALEGHGSPWVALLPALRRRSVFAVKRQLMRRSPDARRLLQRTWNEDGVRGIFAALVFMTGLYRNRALSKRFRALGALPVGSFGRTFHDDFVARGLTFPGERNGIPEKMIHHDLLHIVNDYSTAPEGECQLGGFYAGFVEGDAFTFIMITLTTFQLGMGVSPAVVIPSRGQFDPARVLAAFLRGRRLRVDVMGPWDYWSLFPLPLADVRQQLGIMDDTLAARTRNSDASTPTAHTSDAR